MSSAATGSYPASPMPVELERAEALFERLAGYANDLGLLAEEVDTANDEQLGNFPGVQPHRTDQLGRGRDRAREGCR